ncbi:MAG: cytochrome c [Pseudomonas marincola]
MKIVAAILGVIVVGALFFYGWHTPKPETAVKPDASVSPAASPAVTVAGDELGQQLFKDNCAACHGVNGTGSENGPPFMHKIYEPNHHGDMAFQLAAKNGVRAHHWKFGNMPPVAGVTEREVAEITKFIRKLQKANGIF